MRLGELGARIAERAADGQGFALLFVDCGVVGRVDSAWGYTMGDAMRSRFAAKLRAEVLRPNDLLFEVGRDELALILDRVRSAGVALLAAEKVLRSLDTPVLIEDDEIFAEPAVGIALYPEHGSGEAELLQHARTACRYTRERPERVAVYEKAQQHSESAGLLYENRLRAALSAEGLEVVFQPQIDLRSGLVVGIESLLRWKSGERALVSIEQAIAVAESAGIVNEVTGWVLNDALRNCGEFRQSAGLDLRVCVNLSAKSLRDRDLPDFVSRALGTWGLRPGRLVVEIAETAVLEADRGAADTLRRLEQVGVRLAIDDSGGGYSSLAYLATLPFDEMKINLAPMKGFPTVPQHVTIVESLVGLAHSLRLDVVADGVENEAAAKRVKELGCDYMQGSHVGPALDPTAFAQKFGQ